MIKFILFVALVANVILIASPTTTDCDDDPRPPPPIKTKVCPDNEDWNTCANGGCYSARNCSQIGNPVVCVDPVECKGGCLCKDKFLRNDETGVCVPTDECPNNGCHRENEIFDLCPPTCPPQICGVNQSIICFVPNPEPGSPRCKPSCRCKHGYLRNEKKECVLPEQCDAKDRCTGPNEHYTTCSPCTAATCGQIGKKFSCVAMCRPACRCNDGYYRNRNGVCVLEKDCEPEDKCDGPNEHYTKCSPCTPATCDDIGKNITCTAACVPACRCDKGYYRNSQDTCVLEKDCPKVCPDNEEWNTCANGGCYSARNCSQIGNPVVCVDPVECKGGCLCKDKFLRNDETGVCIPTDECPSKEPKDKCTGPNEYFNSCASSCDPVYCNEIGKNVICAQVCIPACRCNKGYYRNSKGVCILEKDCPPTCSVNEEFSNCTQAVCRNQYCSQVGKPVACPGLTEGSCETGCVCKEGYYRDRKGNCIPEKECPTSCNGDPNARPGCGVNCGRLCSNYKRAKEISCIQVCYPDGCDCIEGTVLDTNTGKCVPPEKCTPTCSVNEEFSNCTQAVCRNQYCSQVGKPVACPGVTAGSCETGCVCKEGYYRDQKGNCIPEKECPSQCPANERYVQCPSTMCLPQRCDQLGYPIACPSPGPDGQCPGKPGCICDAGYVRNNEGKCVPQKECPSCGGDPNAESGCGNHCGRRCSDYKKSNVACPLFCMLNGCNCKKGYVYDDNIRKCVLPEDCTPDCPANEEWNTCANGGCYSARNCSQIGNPVVCVDPLKCKGGCLCKDKFLRNDETGVCVPIDKCPNNECGKNEVYDRCPPVCPPQECGVNPATIRCASNPKPGSPECKPSCRCKDGYVRNDKRECVLPEQCPYKCGNNEEYSECTNGGCFGARKCSEKGAPIKCVKIAPENCIKGCVCRKGYLRNDKGDCIPEDKCPQPCKCGKNEEYSECTNGGCFGARKCSEKGAPVKCVKIAPENCKKGCVCKKGYLRNDKGDCIPEDKCPQRCGKNEVYDLCPPVCPPQECGVNPAVILCAPNPKPGSPECKPSCRCKDGYVRNDKRECVLPEQCPKCDRRNEQYEYCPSTCPPQTCDSLKEGARYNCPASLIPPVCKGQCMCKPGFYRNKLNDCITEENCRKCFGPNEYFSCGGACDNVCATLDKQSQDNCPIINITCNNMCYCDKGYARNKDGVCIPIKDCPCK